MNIRSSWGRAVITAVGLSIVLVATVAGTAVADTELGHTGKVGGHVLQDSVGTPGVKCYYYDEINLQSVFVRGPIMFARDRTAGTDDQQVGWQFTIQRRYKPGKPWTAFYVSTVRKAWATDFTPAPFTNRQVSVDTPFADDVFMTVYRVKISMFWYANGGVSGVAQHRVDWYRVLSAPAYPNHTSGPGGSCPAGAGHF